MNRKILSIILALFVILATGCAQNKADISIGEQMTQQSGGDTRSFYMGVVPTPKSIPATTFDDLTEAYKEAGDLGEVTPVWTDPAGIGQYAKLRQNRVITALRVYGLKPVITLNFATIKEVPGKGLQYVIDAPEGIAADLSDSSFRAAWVDEAKNIAQEFRPEYLSLGNEVNDYFYLHPEELDDYLSLFDETYAAVKKASPQTKVFFVFSYNHLIENDQWDLFEKFDSRADLIGLTTYPWKDFADPEDIPGDHYTRLKQYTSRPIAFTEIGWISSESKGSSEQEQAQFLLKFLELTKDLDVEMINWLFLHETQFQGIIASVSDPETSTIALKKADGTEKAVYKKWVELKEMRYTG